MHRTVWWVAAACAITFAGCGSSEDKDSSAGAPTGATSTASATKDPIVIGAAVAQSGFMAQYDQPAFESLKLGVADINAKGGLLGRQVVIKTSDTQTKPEQASVGAKKLLSQKADVIVTSCDFDFGSPAALAGQAAGKVSFTLCAESPKFGVQGIGPLAYSPAIAGQAWGTGLAQFAESKGWNKLGVMLDDSIEADRAECAGFVAKAKALGLQVQKPVVYKQADTNVQSQVQTIAGQKPDAVMICSYPPGVANVIRQLRNSGVDAPLIGALAMDGTYWQKAVKGLKDFYTPANIAIFGNDPDASANEFIARYTKETGKAPDNGNAVMGYVISQLLAKAISDAGSTDGTKVAAALDKFDGAETLIGPTTFTPTTHIQCYRPFRIMQYTAGKPKFVETITPEGKIDLGVPGQDCPA